MKKNKQLKKPKDNCQHKLAPLLAKYKNQAFPVRATKICLKCGILRIGKHTIRISKSRIDMGNKPIYAVSTIDVASRLRIPVGTNLYS